MRESKQKGSDLRSNLTKHKEIKKMIKCNKKKGWKKLHLIQSVTWQRKIKGKKRDVWSRLNLGLFKNNNNIHPYFGHNLLNFSWN